MSHRTTMGEPGEALFQWLKGGDARDAPPWQLELLSAWPWGREPRPGTFRAMRAALDTAEPDPTAGRKGQ